MPEQHQSLEERLNAEPPTAPRSNIPRIETIARRAQRQRLTQSGSWVGAGALAILVASSFLPNENARPTVDAPSVDLVAQDTPSSDVAVESTDIGAEPNQPKSPPSQETPTLAEQPTSRGLHVFATVRGQVPLFGVDKETQRLEHIGWIESEQRLPVDLDQLSTGQWKSIEAVYRNDGSQAATQAVRHTRYQPELNL